MTAQRYRLAWLGLLALLGGGTIGAYVFATPSEQVIKIDAKKFVFIPNQITLKKGVPVTLQFTSQDVMMGFYVPELGLRTDVIPGQVRELRVVPNKIGEFAFVCDVFCGSGHEDMNGMLTVTE